MGIQFPEDEEFSFATLGVRGGQRRTNEQEHGEPIFTTSSFVYNSAAEAAAKFIGKEAGNVYSRFSNPTIQTFERRLAALEGGKRAVAVGSGMGAILTMGLALLQQGDEIVASRSLFGSTISLFNKYFSKLGIKVRYVALSDVGGWERAISPNTKLFFAETPSNPLAELVDIAELAEVAHRHGIKLVIDNCFCTPALQQPLKLGADLVVHSATKFIDGQGRAIGGAIVGNDDADMEEMLGVVRTCGTSISPFNAWIFLKGLETLKLRMRAHCDNALELARWLEQQPQVEKVYFGGLESHPQHELAKRQQSGFGAVLGFVVKGGQEGAWKVIDATRIVSITGNLGDTKTTITHVATTTHAKLSEEEKAAANIAPGLIRVAVGLEDVDDLKQDLARGLATL
ncbi:O-succinylhomoserine sulfhydrylase [Carnimonas nigrificans]|uniref:O-succinylhomoserine sulfhydrylase n=1 Tax=Carnimonas nigrificans TaxID=64323 RepID=UPI00047274B6|nr:O-succinylhomoserine sulfhydrylase [Carnimonas nigrificans]